jgi:hypothetical protein
VNEQDLHVIVPLSSFKALVDRVEALEARTIALEARRADAAPDILTERQAWEYLHIGRTSLAKLRKEGAIAFSYYAGKAMFRRADLDAFIEREKVKPRRLRAAG